MSTGKDIAARVTAEFSEIKSWEDRVVFPENRLNVKWCMQEEIFALRKENEQLRNQLKANEDLESDYANLLYEYKKVTNHD